MYRPHQWRIWAAINKPANFPPLSLKPIVMSAKHDTTAESIIIMCTGVRFVAGVINENKKPIVVVFQFGIHFVAQ
jgi:hypothetical protein